MQRKGITYDTGFLNAGTSTREPFDPKVVEREMRIIHDDLHCNAVRVTGGHRDRLESAASHAAEAGLEAWLCPFTNGLTGDELLELLADCAGRADSLRRQGAQVVFLTGSELSLFTVGFLPGERLADRLALLAEPQRVRPLIPGIRLRLGELLRTAVEVVRARFGGPVSYAALPFEGVDWGPFDVISSDAGYRTADNAPRFRADIRAFVAQGRALGKPVAITEFGCTTHRGAADVRGHGDLDTVEWGEDARPVRLKGEYTRDEDEQARYIGECLDVFEAEGVDAAFVNTFARWDLPHRSRPGEDLDLASFGVVKVLEGRRGQRYPDLPWEPKAAFLALAARYGSRLSR
ncbi:MAG TPA: hypothetical protein VEQ10_11325 [Vicinamibacteria bacterium]|nr:hypothetical protein [Vicinamibacteria bacterium]